MKITVFSHFRVFDQNVVFGPSLYPKEAWRTGQERVTAGCTPVQQYGGEWVGARGYGGYRVVVRTLVGHRGTGPGTLHTAFPTVRPLWLHCTATVAPLYSHCGSTESPLAPLSPHWHHWTPLDPTGLSIGRG